MNIILIIIAAAGILWLWVSLERGIVFAKNKIKAKKYEDAILKNIPLRDFAVSMLVIWLAYTIFVGVTGMLIGLIASILISAYIRIKDYV